MKALQQFLRPEFINRVDEIVHFNALSEENLKQIAKLMLEEVRGAMAEKDMAFHYTDAVADYLVKKGYRVEKCVAVDMFPYTDAIEAVVALSL